MSRGRRARAIALASIGGVVILAVCAIALVVSHQLRRAADRRRLAEQARQEELLDELEKGEGLEKAMELVRSGDHDFIRRLSQRLDGIDEPRLLGAARGAAATAEVRERLRKGYVSAVVRRVGSGAVTPDAIGLLEEGDADVVAALGRRVDAIRERAVLRAMSRQTVDPAVARRAEAAYADAVLAALGEGADVGEVSELLARKSPRFAAGLTKRLGEIRDTALLRAVAEKAQEPDLARRAKQAHARVTFEQLASGSRCREAEGLLRRGEPTFLALLGERVDEIKDIGFLKSALAVDGVDPKLRTRIQQNYHGRLLSRLGEPACQSEAVALVKQRNEEFTRRACGAIGVLAQARCRALLEAVRDHATDPEHVRAARDALDELRGVITVPAVGKLIWTRHASRLAFIVYRFGARGHQEDTVRRVNGNFVLVAFTKEDGSARVGAGAWSMALPDGRACELVGASLDGGSKYHPMAAIGATSVESTRGPVKMTTVLAFECVGRDKPKSVVLRASGRRAVTIAVPGPAPDRS